MLVGGKNLVRTKNSVPPDGAAEPAGTRDALMVGSVEKAFRVLSVFGPDSHALSLTQIAALTGLDKSAAQRFIHTLTKLGYLAREPDSKRWTLTAKTLSLGHHYMLGSDFIQRSQPYLLQLGQITEEACNLTILDGTEVVFVSRFPSRHMLATDIVVGSRMPAYCSASGVAILSKMPADAAAEILGNSDLVTYTPHTVNTPDELMAKLRQSSERGYATAFDQYYLGDLSIAAAILDGGGRPLGAVNVSVSRARYGAEEAEEKFAPLVMAAAQSASLGVGAR